MLLAMLAAVALRADPVPVAPDEARRLSPDALAERLLAPGHPPAMQVVVGPQGMEPPTPPNSPERTRIRLFLRPVPLAGSDDFCERTIVTLFLKPAWRSTDGTIPATTAENLSTAQAYRWAGDGRAHGCDGSRWHYFQPRPGELAETLDIVRRLARARDRAASHRRLGFAVTLDDPQGREFRALELSDPSMPGPPTVVLTDARAALADMPIGEVGYVGPVDGIGGIPPMDLTNREHGRGAATAALFIGNDWNVGIAWRGDRITRVELIHHYPPPF